MLPQDQSLSGENSRDRLDLALLAQAREYVRCRQSKEDADAALQTAWDAFVWIVEASVRRHRVVRRLPRHRREDVVQEVWLAIFEKLADFQGEHGVRSFHAWLERVIRSKATNEFRKIRRNQALPVEE